MNATTGTRRTYHPRASAPARMPLARLILNHSDVPFDRIAIRMSALAIVWTVFAGLSPASWAKTPLLLTESSGAPASALPARAPGGGRADTLCFGYVQTISGALYAVPGESWTFDHPGGGLEGWYAVDLTADPGIYGRRVDAASWTGHGNVVAAPIIVGTASAWIGLHENEADALCWSAGLGYGNGWCQRWVSPPIAYSGTGGVDLGFRYWNDTEESFDFTHVRIEGDGGEIPLLDLDGKIGDPGTATFPQATLSVSESQLSGWSNLRVVFEFTSDGGWSDEDGGYSTEYGPFGVDDVVVSGGVGGVAYDFEADAQGWLAETCAGVGSFFGAAPLANYGVPDLCNCGHSGNVIGMHAGSGSAGVHPVGQREMAFSPPIDRGALGPSYNDVSASFDLYAELPQANGVFYRAGWSYYPYVCPETGNTQWSGRRGGDTYSFTGVGPICSRETVRARDGGIPGEVAQIGLVLEIYASCDAFLIPPSVCTGVTNFSPLFDNVEICATQGLTGPEVDWAPGGRFMDGFGYGLILDATNVGNADVAYDVYRDTGTVDRLGDSLTVVGPLPTTSTKWEARMWWRISREGPSQTSVPGYATWRDQVRDGLSIVGLNAQFTYGQMDSAQSGSTVYRHRFISEFREQDDDFQGEGANNNEMIRDGILAPGTQIQYFVTANYACTPTAYYYLPDTAGGNFMEFDLLPSYRLDAGFRKFPCLLVVSADPEEGSIVDQALNVALNGAAPGDPLPNLRRWDRYDYLDPTSNWNAPLARSANGNNGLPVTQLLGYRTVILATGTVEGPAMETRDFTLLSDWMSAIVCNGNVSRQGFLASGDHVGRVLTDRGPSFASNNLGIGAACDAYHEPGCGPAAPADESWCVRVDAAAGGLFAPTVDYDVFGNWCPQQFRFDVLSVTGAGVGNRVYADYDRVPPVSTDFAQVAQSVTGANSNNHRTVVSGYSLAHAALRQAPDECAPTGTRVVQAASAELQAALTWIFSSGGGGVPGLCTNPCEGGAVDDLPWAGGRTQLHANVPNPFNPRTTLRFSLAAAGPAELVIYDVSGRKVRTVVDQALEAGEHTAVWDGTDDQGRRVASGVYWSQLRTAGYESLRKMTVLR